MPLVPTASSVHAAPTSKPSRSALLRTPELPSRHSSRPSASVTTIRWRTASTASRSPSRNCGSSTPSWEACRRCSTSSAEISGAVRPDSGSTPWRRTRCHDSPISGRGRTGGSEPASVASRMAGSSPASIGMRFTLQWCPSGAPARRVIHDIATPCNHCERIGSGRKVAMSGRRVVPSRRSITLRGLPSATGAGLPSATATAPPATGRRMNRPARGGYG